MTKVCFNIENFDPVTDNQEVGDLLRCFLRDALDRRRRCASLSEEVNAASNMANLFLEQHVWVRKRCNLENGEPSVVMTTFFVVLLTDFYKICDYATLPGVTDDLVSLQIDTLIGESANVLVEELSNPQQEIGRLQAPYWYGN